MKKLLFVSYVLCSALIGSAQVQFGVKAGLNVASLHSFTTDIPGATLSNRISFNGGLMASIPLSSKLSIQSEVSYSGQGQKLTSTLITATLQMDYINVPALLKYRLPESFFVETGPQVGFLISSHVKEDNGMISHLHDGEAVDFSWAFGLGYKAKSFPIGIDLRYNLGLTFNSIYGYAKNSVFQFDLFYLFKIN